jgi:hypothetical protein
METPFEDAVAYMMLLLRPDHAYITPDGTKIYLLNADQTDVIVIQGENLQSLSNAELNEYIQNALK